MPEFINPNNPQQPQRGVYFWKCERENEDMILYVGNAGERPSLLTKGTLYRGVLEAQRGLTISTDGGITLDTDFIVGTAIEIFEEEDWKCYWKHQCDDPTRESYYCGEMNPILQNGRRISPAFKHRSDVNRWVTSEDNIEEARLLIHEDLIDWL